MTRIVRLAFLAPEVVEAMLTGMALPQIDGMALSAAGAGPAAWADQRRAMLANGTG